MPSRSPTPCAVWPAVQGVFSPEVTRALASIPSAPDRALATLTARELEIAELVAEGRTNAEIAKQLDLSIFTVKNHVSNVLTKLHAQTRTEVGGDRAQCRQGVAEAPSSPPSSFAPPPTRQVRSVLCAFLRTGGPYVPLITEHLVVPQGIPRGFEGND